MAQPSRGTSAFVVGLLVWLSLVPSVFGQTTSFSPRPLSEESVRRAVASLPPPPLEPRQADWAGVERLAPGTKVVVHLDSRTSVDGELVSVEDAGLSLRRPSGSIERIARATVVEIRDMTRRGSKRNAVIGAGAGAFLGYVMALNLALRDCGGSCSDERFLVGLSLVGTPVAGGFIGYHVFARSNRLVYRRPSP